MARPGTGGTRRRSFRRDVGHWLGLVVVSVVMSLAAGEVALRALYRDRGRTTLGGPGGLPFDYAYNAEGPGPEDRQPQPAPAKLPGLTRIAIQGDSITWGVGVRDWTALYPSRLLGALRRLGGEYDVVVEAVPGYNADRHADHVQRLVDEFAPDVLIYQWYPNDLDVGGRWQVAKAPWQRWPYHERLQELSFLYFFLDNRLRQLADPTYLHHLQRDFDDGSNAWSAFRDAFHRWATVASGRVPRTILLLYPQVPFSGENPLGDLHRRMTALATGTTRLEYPPRLQRGAVGAIDADITSRLGEIRRTTGEAGLFVSAGQIPLLPGHYAVDFRVRLDRPHPQPGRVAVVEEPGDVVLAERALPTTADGWVDLQVPFDVETRPLAHDVAFRVDVSAGAAVSADTLGLEVRYRNIEVLDPTPVLNTFDTHASVFDAHPNERAHGELARLLFERLRPVRAAGQTASRSTAP